MYGYSSEAISLIIEEYEKHAFLYSVRDPFYHNKQKRNQALQQILQKILKIRPNTTITELKTKINSLRTTYMNEKKKINLSIKSGQDASEVYIPSLWYFDKLRFLDPHLTSRESKSYLPKLLKPNEKDDNVVKDETNEEVLSDVLSLESTTEKEFDINSPVSFQADKESFENLDMSIISDSNTIRNEEYAPLKPKRRRKSENELIKTATNTLHHLTVAMENSSNNKQECSKNDYSRETSFANFVISRLILIKHSAIKLKAEYDIIKVLQNAELEDMNNDSIK